MHDTESPAFAQIPPELRPVLAQVANQRHYADGAVIFQQHQPPAGVFCITQGAARIDRLTEDGKSPLFGFIPPHLWFGVASVVDSQPHTHRAIAWGKTQLLWIPAREFSHLIDSDPRVCRLALTWTVQYLRRTADLLDEAHSVPLSQLLARRLLHFAKLFGVPDGNAIRMTLKLSQEDLAHLLGATRQRINQIFAGWQHDKIVEVEYRQVVILDMAGLRKAAQLIPGVDV
jgi:CRP-like cAMP-binding protein